MTHARVRTGLMDRIIGAGGLALLMGLLLSVSSAFAQSSSTRPVLLFIWCSFFGADAALRKKQHIIIDIVVRLFPPKVQRALLITHWTVMIAFLLTLVVLGVELTMLNVQRPMGDTEISYAYVTAAVPVGSLLMALTAMRQLVEFWRDPDLVFGEGESVL